MKPYPNASPISPQGNYNISHFSQFVQICEENIAIFLSHTGMVQICSECNEKHINLAQAVSIDKGSDSKSINFGNGSGRFSPSDSKSLANSDSSYVRFKVRSPSFRMTVPPEWN